MDDISLKNIEEQILAFNNDPDVFALRNRYSTKTFLDIMSVSRSENRHSAFLAWLLEGNDFAVAPQDHPIVHLLDCIIKRVQDQGIEVPEERGEGEKKQKNKIDNYDKLKEIILTRNIKSIQIDEVKTEKVLGDLCEGVNGIPKLDRIDIYIRCAIITKDSNRWEFEFIIENKVSSEEGEKPTSQKELEGISCKYIQKQTVRYYLAGTYESRRNKPKQGSIFVFLTPDIEKHHESPYFIHITYQDVLDKIIEPLLLPEVNISDRIRLLLEEYISSLSLPAYEQSDDPEENSQQIKNALIMAVRREESKQLLKIWQGKQEQQGIDGYKSLLIDAIKAYNNNEDGVLKSFCEVNKALIIAILRIATESNSTNNELKQAYKDLVKSKRDYSTFKIDNGKENSKGIFFVEIVKLWAKKYNEKNKTTIPDPVVILKNINLSNKKNDDTIIDEERYNNLESKKDKGKKGPQERYFKDSDLTVTIGERIYYLSTEWGIGIRLDKWLKFLGFDPKKFNEAVNSEEFTKKYTQSESNSIGEKLMCDLDIKSITWKKILK